MSDEEKMQVMGDSNKDSNMTSQLNLTFNYTGFSIARDMTIHSEEHQIAMDRNVELDILYKAVVQGIVFMCLASFVGGLIVLFICLKIIQKFKVKNCFALGPLSRFFFLHLAYWYFVVLNGTLIYSKGPLDFFMIKFMDCLCLFL